MEIPRALRVLNMPTFTCGTNTTSRVKTYCRYVYFHHCASDVSAFNKRISMRERERLTTNVTPGTVCCSAAFINCEAHGINDHLCRFQIKTFLRLYISNLKYVAECHRHLHHLTTDTIYWQVKTVLWERPLRRTRNIMRCSSKLCVGN